MSFGVIAFTTLQTYTKNLLYFAVYFTVNFTVYWMKLNLGCGQFKLPGFINIDVNPNVNPDVCDNALHYVAKLTDQSVEEIYMGHFIEHLIYEDIHFLMDQIKRVLRPDGKLLITVPDAQKAITLYNAGLLRPKWLDLIYFGARDAPHEFHYSIWSYTRLEEVAKIYGFRIVREHMKHKYLTAVVNWQTCVEMAIDHQRKA